MLFIILIIFVIVKLYESYGCENFSMYNTYQSVMPSFNIPLLNGYTNFPWYNTRLGNTNNMSYDLRGDPTVIPKKQFIWNNSSFFQIFNKII